MKFSINKAALISMPLVLAAVLVGCGGGGGSSSSGSSITQEYSGNDLGANLDSNGDLTFKVWLPTKGSASLAFYSATDSSAQIGSIALDQAEDFAETGIYQKVIKPSDLGVADLTGVFYQLKAGGANALDPYARSLDASTGRNAADASSTKAAIVDHNKYQWQNPGYADLPIDWKREDAIIYEIHVRDFTVDPDVESDLKGKKFGTYSAFIEKLDYIKALGVTHVQLLPVQAYFYGDETKSGTREWEEVSSGANYNWGYDPHSYFAPEGMYASDVNDAQSRVDELKSLIDAIHGKGMAVTLDVVYNHHPFTDIYNPLASGYYYRSVSNSGAGTDIASEKAMVHKLIVDSLTYWTKEYKVDGFRFDLMGLIDAETIQVAYDESAKLNPNTLFIGEGWKMCEGDSCKSGVEMADQLWMTSTDDVGSFSDSIRNLIKSGYGAEEQPRFATGGKEDTAYLMTNIQANPQDNNFANGVDDPGDVIQYVAAHDNLTLHDVVAYHLAELDSTKTAESAKNEIHRRIRIANAMILTSQGSSFIHAGQEYGRTKACASCSKETTTTKAGEKFVHNSYDSSDLINHFDWSAVETAGINQDTMEYTKGLIALRKSSDAFRLATPEEIAANVEMIATGDIAATDNAIAFKTKSSNGLEQFYVFVNADTESRQFNLLTDLTSADVLVDGEQAGIEPIDPPVGVSITADSITIAPLTSVVVKL